MEKEFVSVLRSKLIENGIGLSDVDFIMSFIEPSSIDENLWRMNNDAYTKLCERGLWEPLNKAITELGGGSWNHSNEPLQ